MPTRRAILSLLAAAVGALVGSPAAAAGAGGARPPRRLGLVPMPPTGVVALAGGAGAMVELDVAALGVPAAAGGVMVAGWARVEPPGKLWAFSDAQGQHGGVYHVREGAVNWAFVPADRGEVCFMGSGAWNADLRVIGYWI